MLKLLMHTRGTVGSAYSALSDAPVVQFSTRNVKRPRGDFSLSAPRPGKDGAVPTLAIGL